MLDLLKSAFAFGLAGMVVEVFFTGIASLVNRNWNATCQTYLWMLPCYGIAGVAFDHLNDWLQWPFWAMGFVLTPLIYAIEFGYGWLLLKTIGRCPWDYGRGKYTIMGLIRLDFAPFWYLLACCVPFASPLLKKVVAVVSSELMGS